MGLNREAEKYEKNILKRLGLKYKDLKWCELGDQKTYKVHGKKKIAKDWYLSYGVKHISLDLNGRNGALIIDLDLPVPFVFLNQFDVITNYGTIEHVDNQYQVFKNVHDMCKIGGIMIHVMPLIGNWPEHCRYYYSKNFVRELVNVCDYEKVKYEILDNIKPLRKLIAVTYIKKKNNKFITKKKFDKIGGVVDELNLKRVGNYTVKNENKK